MAFEAEYSRLGLLQVCDCKKGWHLKQNKSLNSVGEDVQNCDKEH